MWVDALETIDEGASCWTTSSRVNDDEEFECNLPRRLAFVLAGLRAEIAFDPSDCRAAVVTSIRGAPNVSDEIERPPDRGGGDPEDHR